MTDLTRRARVDALLDAALEQPAAERAAWLERACAGEAALRAEVERLLALGEREDDLLRPRGAQEGPLWDEVATELREPREAEGLAPGDRVGPYRIDGLLGRGGAGTVYAAWDPKLERAVAVKALSSSFTDDLSNLRRFEREAKVLASLGHPNVASIYELLWSGGRPFLVLELVEGETLGQRLERGPLPLRETLQLGVQLAEALEEAHRRGVVHRDLKPSNVMVSSSGRVKVLDFGLAKTVVRSPREAATPGAARSTSTTREGVVVGTPAYMSPEQARGEEVDHRTDVWALGCLLYEMLTGRRAFGGRSVSEAISSVLRDEADWAGLPSTTPAPLLRILRRCLQKDAHERLQAVGDLRIELQDVLLAGPPRERPRRGPLLAGAAALLAALALAWLLRPRAGEGAPTSPGVVRAVLGVGSEVRLWLGASRSLAISRDGSRVAFVGEQSGRTRLYLRELDAFEAHALADSEDARNPFFSPDGAWIGYFARGELRKVSVAGRAAERLAAAGNESRGAAWSDDGRIVFAQAHAEGLFLLEPGSGAARLITSVDRPAGEQEHLWPEWLPAGRGLVFTVRRRGPAGSVDELFVLGPDEKAGRRLRPGSQPVFAGTGHLLFLSAGGVEAAPFDLSSRELRGAAASVLDAVHTYPQGAAAYALARAGTFVYLPPLESTVLDWVGPAGDVMALPTPPGTPGWPRIAPDGRRVAIHVGRPGSRELWLLDAARAGAFRQLTFAGGGFPVWSADGRWIAFASRSDDAPSLYVVPADGDAPPRRVYAGRGTVVPTAWSRQGMLAFYEVTEARQRDVLVLDVKSGGPAAPVVAGPANELAPSFSPDGRLLAYVSNETGRNEVWVRPFPPRGPATAVTVDGGIEPVWSRDGSRLLYRAGDSLWAVEVQGPGPVRLGAPRKLVDTAMVPNAAGNPGYDLAPDGRFLILRGASGVAADTLHVVLGFERELARPTAGRPR